MDTLLAHDVNQPTTTGLPLSASVSPAATPVLPTDAGLVGASSDVAKQLPYPPLAPVPTQAGPEGIWFDFNIGARVVLPSRTVGTWRTCLRDLNTGNILFESEHLGRAGREALRDATLTMETVP